MRQETEAGPVAARRKGDSLSLPPAMAGDIAPPGAFIGTSATMRALYTTLQNAASSRATVFITGESGTGKDVCAQTIHRLSARAGGPFIALNCAAIPAGLLESELFGHVKGAFTGAIENREGAVARARGGTLFLDEICDMDPDMQSKLLRFVQSLAYTKVGGSREEAGDVRIICATNRDPAAEIEAGRFRHDLYYRLHVVSVFMRPCAAARRIFWTWRIITCSALRARKANISAGLPRTPKLT